MKKIAIHQPNFLSWGGFFEKMESVDEFVMLSSVQFTKGSYINRCKMGKMDNPFWFTQPVCYKFGEQINQVQLFQPRKFCNKLYKSIRQYYPKLAPHFMFLMYYPPTNLLDLNMQLIKVVKKLLGINSRIIMDTELEIEGLQKSDLILGICKQRNANTYICGGGVNKYLDLEKFKENKVNIEFVDYSKKYKNITILHYLNELVK